MERIKYLILVFLLLMLPGCSATKKLPVTTNQSDSVRIETRYIKYTEKDTVYLEIPAQTAERTTKDSVSNLENDYAVSTARINADGTLYHDLNTKPQKKPIPTEKQVERKDSIVYVDKKVEIPVYIEKELSKWQKIKMGVGMVAIILAVIALLLSAIHFWRK